MVVAVLALGVCGWLLWMRHSLPQSARVPFLEGARQTCAASIERATGLDLDRRGRARYCECVARELSESVTRGEIEQLRKTREFPRSLEEKSLAASAACWREIEPSTQ